MDPGSVQVKICEAKTPFPFKFSRLIIALRIAAVAPYLQLDEYNYSNPPTLHMTASNYIYIFCIG
jgi:hypothetical protein